MAKNQVIVMSSDNQYHTLPAFFHQWYKYFYDDYRLTICGFSVPQSLPNNCEFYSIGNFEDYPPGKWSDALINALENVADDVFMLLLGDYLLVRPADINAIRMAYDYLRQFQYVIKFDLTSDRLNSDPGYFAYNNNNYGELGYLDLIKSLPNSPYHMSLWGGLWRKDLMLKILIPGETAQQIEINGTHRLSQYGDDILVLGTRQSPLKHANVVQGGKWNHDALVGLKALRDDDKQELEKLGYL